MAKKMNLCCGLVCGVVVGGMSAGVLGEVSITDLHLTAVITDYRSTEDNGQAGKRVASLNFDLDNGGLNDLLVGAPHAEGTLTDAGRVYVVSSETGLPLIEFTHAGQNAFGLGVDNLGVRADPDDNGTERPLIAMSAAGDGAASPTSNRRGVYVVHLTSELMASYSGTPLDVDQCSSIKILGEVYDKLDEMGNPTGSLVGDRLGYNVANAGDLNDDGIVDLAAGANKALGWMRGRVYFYLMPAEVPNISAFPPNVAENPIVFELANDPPMSAFPNGEYVRVTMPSLSLGGGGSVSLPAGASTSAGTLFQVTSDASTNVNTNFGEQVSPAGDFNNDGVGDLIVGAPNWRQPVPKGLMPPLPAGDEEEPQQTGSAYVLGLRDSDANGSLDQLYACQLVIPIEDDVDIVIGPRQPGSPDPNGPDNLDSIDDGQLLGKDLYCAGLFTEDGISDVMIGAKHYGPLVGNPGEASAGGRVYLFAGFDDHDPALFDSTSQLMHIFQSEINPNTMLPRPFWRFGASLDMLGDLDGDGRTDIAMAATTVGFKGDNQTGGAWVYLSSDVPDNDLSDPTLTLDDKKVTAAAALEVKGTQAFQQLGKHMRHGFVSNDCNEDLIIGAWRWDNSGATGNGMHHGRAIVVDVYEAIGPFPSCIEDLDGDGMIGAGDLAKLVGNWMQPCPQHGCCPADFDRDGNVNAADLAELIGMWNATCPTHIP